MISNKKILWSAYFGILVFGMAMLSLGTANAYLSIDLNLSQMLIASMATLLPVGILGGSLVFGPIVDRYGYKIILIVCTGLIALSFFLISIFNSLIIFQASFFMIGFAGGAINGSTSALVADLSENNKGAGLSLLGVFYGIGALGMPLLNGLLSKTLSYQAILQIFAIIVIFPIIYFIFNKFPEPKQKQGFPIAKGISLFKKPLILLIGFFLFFESGLEGIANNWTTTFLRDSTKITPESSLYALSIMIVMLTLTRLVLGELLKKISGFLVLNISLGFVFVGCLCLAGSSELFLAYTGMGLLGVGFAAAFPVVLGIVGELYPEISGTAFSVVFFIALIGNTLMNYIVGVMSNKIGIDFFPVIICISAIIMIMLLLKIKIMINRK